jgi:hypothetical protein
MAATDAASELLNVSILPIRFVAHPCLPRSQGQLLVYTDLQSALEWVRPFFVRSWYFPLARYSGRGLG